MKRLLIEGELTALNEYINAERRNRHIAAKIKKDETGYCQDVAEKNRFKITRNRLSMRANNNMVRQK